MAIPVDMIYDDDTTRKSVTAYIICMYVCICIVPICTYVFIIIFTIQFCGVRHGHCRLKNAFTGGRPLLYIIYENRFETIDSYSFITCGIIFSFVYLLLFFYIFNNFTSHC